MEDKLCHFAGARSVYIVFLSLIKISNQYHYSLVLLLLLVLLLVLLLHVQYCYYLLVLDLILLTSVTVTSVSVLAMDDKNLFVVGLFYYIWKWQPGCSIVLLIYYY